MSTCDACATVSWIVCLQSARLACPESACPQETEWAVDSNAPDGNRCHNPLKPISWPRARFSGSRQAMQTNYNQVDAASQGRTGRHLPCGPPEKGFAWENAPWPTSVHTNRANLPRFQRIQESLPRCQKEYVRNRGIRRRINIMPSPTSHGGCGH